MIFVTLSMKLPYYIENISWGDSIKETKTRIFICIVAIRPINIAAGDYGNYVAKFAGTIKRKGNNNGNWLNQHLI